MKTLFIWTLLLCTLAAPAIAADSGLKGKDAPDFKATRCINSPADGQMSLEDCKGEVILVKLWGCKCPPCLASMPEVNALWVKYEGKGLHIFMLERQGHDENQISKLYSSKGLTMPQVIEGDFGGYPGVGTIPYAYVIGVDGKVIFEGHSGYPGVIDEEIKKVKYIGLGKQDIAKGLEKAAGSFAARQYSKAADEAKKAMEKGNDAVKADAQFILDRIEAVHAKLLQRAGAAKEERRFADAVAALTEIAVGFKGTQQGSDADNEIKELKKDKDIKKELAASDALSKLADANKKLKNSEQVRALRDFAKKNEGTRAATDASLMADRLESNGQ